MNLRNVECIEEIYEQYIKPYVTKNTSDATIAGLLLAYGAQMIHDNKPWMEQYEKDVLTLQRIDDFAAMIKYICKEK